jgi:putative peptidoglycan lipid II flippase
VSFAPLTARVRRWQQGSVNRRIFGAAVVVGVLSMMARLMTAGKDLVVAARFGTSIELDAFLIAAALPLFASSTIAGSIPSSLTPVYLRVRQQQGEVAARRLLATTFGATLVLFATATVLLAFAGSGFLYVLTGGRAAAAFELAKHLYLPLLPLVFFGGITSYFSAILNSNQRFAAPAAAPALSSIVPAVFLLIWPSLHALVIGTVLGAAAEMVSVLIAARRDGHSLRPRLGPLDPGVRDVVRAYTPMLMGALLASSSPIIDQIMATRLGPGNISTLSYGNKVVSFLLSFGALALGTAVLPHFSILVSERRWGEVKHTLRTWSIIIVVITVPAVIVGMLCARVLVRLLFQRANFSEHDTEATASVLIAYLPQLPFYLLGILSVRLLSALQRNRDLMLIAAVSVTLNFVGDYAFMNWLGVNGIALSTSVVYGVSTTLVLLAIRSALRDHEARTSTREPPPGTF